MKKFILILNVIVLLVASPLYAGDEIRDLSIISIRPYSGGDIFIETNASSNLCDTSTFTIDSNAPDKRELYAAALAALTAGKKIGIEISNATGCTGWGTKLQSIYIFN